jgi:pyrroline-5-carboxylate reductase
MGCSLIGGLINNKYPPEKIISTDINAQQRKIAAKLFGIKVINNNVLAAKNAGVIVLAVKPDAVKEILSALQHQLIKTKPLLISIAAGIRLSDITRWAGGKIAAVRIMPNTPALINTGAAALCSNRYVSLQQREIAEMIMRSVGITIWVDNEQLINAVTALSGSGPAYFFYIMELIEKAGMDLGLNENQARLLTLQTALGAAKMALESDVDLQTLRKRVTSPGGTTEQALNVLENAKLEKIIHKAMRAAYEKSEEIARIYGENK